MLRTGTMIRTVLQGRPRAQDDHLGIASGAAGFRLLLGAMAAALLAGCTAPAPGGAPPSPAAPAADVPGATPAVPGPAAEPPPAESFPPAPVTWASAGGGGADTPLRRDGETAVEPGAAFRLEAAVPFADARLALYDAQERLVPAEGRTEVGTAGTRFSLAPAARLRPGARYALRLEGASGREIHDLARRAYRPVAFALVAAGEPVPDPPPRARKRKAKRPA